jgi:hypothetical protein
MLVDFATSPQFDREFSAAIARNSPACRLADSACETGHKAFPRKRSPLPATADSVG